MADPRMKVFAGRLRRIDRIHRRGGGFEAAGTLGQSYYTQAQRRSQRSVAKPAFLFVALFIAFKATLVAHQGSATYLSQIAELQAGSVAHQFAAMVLALDPLTEMVSVWFGTVIK